MSNTQNTQIGYPGTVDEVIRPVKYKQATKDLMRHIKFEARPWRGTVAERKTKFRAIVDSLNHIYQPDNPVTLVFAGLDGNTETAQGNGSYNSVEHKITIVNKLSLVTLLHEFAHSLGADEHRACYWSINLYRIYFPRLFAKMERHGHLLIAPTNTETEEVI